MSWLDPVKNDQYHEDTGFTQNQQALSQLGDLRLIVLYTVQLNVIKKGLLEFVVFQPTLELEDMDYHIFNFFLPQVDQRGKVKGFWGCLFREKDKSTKICHL